MRNRFAASVLLSLVCFVGEAQSATVTFSDGTFQDSDWTAQKIMDTTPGQSATFSAERVLAGGNPGEWRKDRLVWENGQIIVAHLRNEASYDPSVDGGIISVAMSYDLWNGDEGIADDEVAYGGMLYQNGSYYCTSPYDVIRAPTVSPWAMFPQRKEGSV